MTGVFVQVLAALLSPLIALGCVSLERLPESKLLRKKWHLYLAESLSISPKFSNVTNKASEGLKANYEGANVAVYICNLAAILRHSSFHHLYVSLTSITML